MKKNINKILLVSQKIRKEWFLCFLLGIGLIVACQGALEEGNPFGPSNSNIVINPSSPKINKGGTLTFTAFGGTLPLSWSLSSNAIGAINAGTGVFTSNQAAPQVAGIVTVTVVDAVGDTDTATIEVLPAALAIAPGSSTQQGAGNEVFTVTGGSGELVVTISNNASSTTYTIPTLAVAGNQVTVTYTNPTNAQGTQTLTIAISDQENGDTGSVVLTVIPDGTT